MSAPMVRALLAGTKTQTRRVSKQQPSVVNQIDSTEAIKRFGQCGDRLWVRETFGTLTGAGVRTVYRADGDEPAQAFYPFETIPDMKWTPSIFMRRSASRIMLEVLKISVEHLHDIDEQGAMAEGVTSVPDALGMCWVGSGRRVKTAREAFADLWESINGPKSWAANPWVWVIEFKRVRP